MKHINHDKYLKMQTERCRKSLGKESAAQRKLRIELQGGSRAFCGSVYGDKRRKLMEKAICME